MAPCAVCRSASAPVTSPSAIATAPEAALAAAVATASPASAAAISSGRAPAWALVNWACAESRRACAWRTACSRSLVSSTANCWPATTSSPSETKISLTRPEPRKARSAFLMGVTTPSADTVSGLDALDEAVPGAAVASPFCPRRLHAERAGSNTMPNVIRIRTRRRVVKFVVPLSIAQLLLGTMPVRMAIATASVRELTPSLLRMLVTCAFTVRSVMLSCAAICLLAAPSAISRSTSCSR